MMITVTRFAILVTAALFLAIAPDAQAQQNSMSFFVTSTSLLRQKTCYGEPAKIRFTLEPPRPPAQITPAILAIHTFGGNGEALSLKPCECFSNSEVDFCLSVLRVQFTVISDRPKLAS
jgi:hypothetical protein